MYLKELKGKKILILGYGVEGRSTERYLRKNIPDAEIGIADKKDGYDYLNKQYEYDLVIKTPGIPSRKLKVPYTTATNLFFANKGNAQVVGVTGTKGKSTTASLIHHIFKNAGIKTKLVGNIGKPALDFLIDPASEETVYVYELSSYQLEDIQYSPHIGVVLSLFPDHMNYHLSKSYYYKAKKNIIKYMGEEDFYVYNPKYPLLAKWAKDTEAHSVEFETDFSPEVSPLLGLHNLDNIHAAITASRLYGITDNKSISAVYTFKPLPHRLEYIGTYGEVAFYDDAISTTPESTLAAISSIKNIDTIFLGGENRGYKFERLALKIAEKNISNIVLFPDSGKDILNELKKISKFKPNILKTDNMEDAVKFAFKVAKPNTSCVLSCASPSYSLWKNYIEKGNEFKRFVETYGKKNTFKTQEK